MALFHDLGKLTILDIIAMYGRRLLDSEFTMLREHPDNGAFYAEAFDSTKEYADVVRGHHLWYDGSRGYPKDFDSSKSPYLAELLKDPDTFSDIRWLLDEGRKSIYRDTFGLLKEILRKGQEK